MSRAPLQPSTDACVEEVSAVFWDYLKRDPKHKDRRLTAWGSYTKLGLALTIQRLGEKLTESGHERH